ncbi:hypothetical protein ARAM_003527 [Aspergillus rambellii]|uniref:Uncharacterized protein n=1 Tax=Aspergillus rambellii TaxID=308745 RepID=A0A0F8XQY9_9EURO|nr:hypothetical protein ARAM_003527 [Aspergillus rambellii]
MRLHSFFEPGLRAKDTTYTLTARQSLSSGNQKLPLKTSEIHFTVDAPRFTLPPSDIHSVYPAPGSSEHARVLPHVVLNDPQLPWERSGDPENQNHANKNDQKPTRPTWMALLVFTADELQVTPLANNKNIPSATRALSAVVSQLAQADKAESSFRCPNVNDLDAADETVASYIVLKRELFEHLIMSNISTFAYLSHVRRVAVAGSAHVSDTPDEHPFSVVVSPRTGPVDGKEQTVYVHLVSLDGIVENLKTRSLTDSVKTIGVVSLYAWTYRISPGDEISYRDILCSLDKDKQPLCRPKSLLNDLAKDVANSWLVERLRQGYTLTRHRTLTGEATVAFYRGPLTPSYLPPGQCPPSVAGRELQILDPHTGIMDVSYSVAWELGRNLAIADKAFTAAMLRLRSDIMAQAVKDPEKSKSKDTFAALKRTHKRPALYTDHVRKWLADMATSQAQHELENKTNQVSTDWLFVLQWIQKKLALQGIPAIYLFPDPAVLPLEALRTFYIDENWTDAMIDGALSIANHSTTSDDLVKREIRSSFNVYLTAMQKDQKPDTAYSWRPRWGLVLRSQLVRAYPNLRIEREHKDSTDLPAAFATLSEDTLIYYQSETPETTEDAALIMMQPFHHQRFSLGDDLAGGKLEMAFKLFTLTESEKARERIESSDNRAIWTPGSNTAVFKCKNPDGFKDVPLKAIYDWTIRCVDIKQLIQCCQDINKEVLQDLSDVQEDSSAYVGVQLNDEILMLRMEYKRPGGIQPLQPRLLNNPVTTSPENKLEPDKEKNKEPKKKRKTPFIPEPPLIKAALLPPVQGFNLDALKPAIPSIPKNDAAYNNLLPITTSQLSKICSPLLEQRRRNLPAGAPITLDLLFSLTAIADVRQDLYLGEVNIYLPMGTINTNLLQPITSRPKMRMIGPGRLWDITCRLVMGKRHRIDLQGDWSLEDATDGHDQRDENQSLAL